MKITSNELLCFCVSALLLIQPAFCERGERSTTLARGGEARQLKGGKGSLKASKIKTQEQLDAAINKVAAKCDALQKQIITLNTLFLQTTNQLPNLATAVETQAAAVLGVNSLFPEDPTAANKYLTECRDLEDDVNAYKKTVSDAARIDAQITSSEAELQRLEGEVKALIDAVELVTDLDGVYPTVCEVLRR